MIRGYCISDIHFGCMDNKILYGELKKVFLNRIIKDEEKIDLIVICGDLLDHKLSFNSEASKLCIEFINKLSLLCIKKKIVLRIVKGTKNHDLDQLNNFIYLQNKNNLDFKIINKVQDEIIKENRILYIPEEYMENANDYYKEYFNEKYDLCFVHGTFNHVEFVSKTINSERPISNAPIFSYKQFSKMVKGPVLCGHIHITQNYKNKIFYTGSFSRWKFGEEKKKGFMSFIIDDKDNYEVKFIRNKYAREYITKDITEIINISSDNIEKEIDKIKDYKEKNNIFKLRVTIDKNFSDNINSDVLKTYFSNNEENVKVVKENVIKVQQENEEEDNKYSFIFNNEYGDDVVGMAKNISKYLEIHDNITLSEDIIEELLTSEN